MRLNRHGNFKVQLFEQIKKDDCAPSLTVPHLPLLIYWKYEIKNSYSLEWFIIICIGWNLWFSKFAPLEDEIFPRG